MTASRSGNTRNQDRDQDINNDGLVLFKSAISRRNLSGRPIIHKFKCITSEWVRGIFNISVCDLLFDAAFALNEKDYPKAKQMMDAAVHIMKIWKKDELMLGGIMTARPDEKIKTRHGIITLSKLNKLVKRAAEDVEKLVTLESDCMHFEQSRQNALASIKNALNEVAPNNARAQEKALLNSL